MKYSLEEINKMKPSGSRLIVVRFGDFHYFPSSKNGKQRKERKVVCTCSCGITKQYFVHQVTKRVISCGCYSSDVTTAMNKARRKHFNGKPKQKRDLYTVYHNIKQRCYNPNHKAYKNYGGRGVIMCDEWLNSWPAFKTWALANGYKKGLEIDKDKLGNGLMYSPWTCCWITRPDNLSHKSNSKRYEFNGQILIAAQIAKILGIDATSFRRRLRKMPLEDAIVLGRIK